MAIFMYDQGDVVNWNDCLTPRFDIYSVQTMSQILPGNVFEVVGVIDVYEWDGRWHPQIVRIKNEVGKTLTLSGIYLKPVCA